MKLFFRVFGLLLVLAGLSSALYYFAFFDISVTAPGSEVLGIPSRRVANLSLMQQQQTGMIFGFGLAVVGGVLLYLGHDRQAADERTCPSCAETIKADAKVCRFCKADLTTEPTTRSSRSRFPVVAAGILLIGVPALAWFAAWVAATF